MPEEISHAERDAETFALVDFFFVVIVFLLLVSGLDLEEDFFVCFFFVVAIFHFPFGLVNAYRKGMEELDHLLNIMHLIGR